MSDLDPQDPTSNEPASEAVSFAAAATPPGRGRRAGRAALWIAVGAVGATALSGVAFAANRTESATPSPAPTAPKAAPSPPAGAPAPGDRMRGPGGPGGRVGHGMGGALGFGIGDVLHGEFVVKDGDATKTMLGQQGEVTAASSTSLTVKSTDGFVGTWSLGSSTKVFAFVAKGKTSTVADLKKGDDVTVIGTKSSDTSGAATIVRVRPTQAQLDELRKNLPQWRDGQRPVRPGGAAPTPSSSPSAAA